MKIYKISKSIYDYLIWEPEGELRLIADSISKMDNNSAHAYRGMSTAELNSLKTKGKVVSKGIGNTRSIMGSYVSDDIQLAGRFALVNYRENKEGVILVMDKRKLPNLTARDEGNYTVDYIPIESVMQEIHLSSLIS